MTDTLRHFPLDQQYELIVEINPIYQPHLGTDAHFAGIWPLEGQGPAAKTWVQAATPADAFQLAKQWANDAMARLQAKPEPEQEAQL